MILDWILTSFLGLGCLIGIVFLGALVLAFRHHSHK